MHFRKESNRSEMFSVKTQTVGVTNPTSVDYDNPRRFLAQMNTEKQRKKFYGNNMMHLKRRVFKNRSKCSRITVISLPRTEFQKRFVTQTFVDVVRCDVA